MEITLYRELRFLSGTKVSKRAEKMLKMTLVLENQFSQQTRKCGSDARCNAERLLNECQDDAEETGLDKSAVHRILNDLLHMRKMYAKLVPKTCL